MNWFWLCWVFTAAHWLFSGCGEQGLLSGPSGCGEQGLLSGPGGRASRRRGSSCGVQALERGLQKLWYRSLAAPKHMESSRSRDRIPVPALPSRFLTPGPPGKSEEVFWLFHFIFWLPYGMWELSSLTREQTWVPAVEAQSPNHWTTGESPCFVLFLI